MRKDITDTIRNLCKWKGVETIETCNAGSYLFSGHDSAEIEYAGIHELCEKKKCDDDLRQAFEPEI